MNTHDAQQVIKAADLIIRHLDRIATALERTADADPLTMLDAAMKDQVLNADGEPMSGPFAELQEPIASNGMTVIYAHPNPEYQVVARRDASVDGGFSVSVEEA